MPPATPPEGRVALTIYPLSFFEPPAGSNQPDVKPYPNELALDEDNGIILYAKYDDVGNYVWTSKVKDLMATLENLQNTGILDNARAFVQNRKIYRMYFDGTRKTLRLDSTLRFDFAINRYYSVRKPVMGADGTFTYITGIKDTSGVLRSTLVDMGTVVEGGNTYAISGIGSTLEDPIDGQSYVVEFYDSSRLLTNTLVFQAIAVKAQSIDLAPDNAITDLVIISNRQDSNNPNAVYLFKGEPISNLDYRVFLKYADGSLRDINYELFDGGKLTITGLDAVVTTVVTGSNTPQKFNVKYYMVRSNAAVNAVNANGLTINPTELSISRDVSVIVRDDLYDEIIDIYPVPFVLGSFISGTAQGYLKVFALYKSMALRDVTSVAAALGFSGSSASFGIQQNVTFNIPQGHGNQIYSEANAILIQRVAGTEEALCKSGADDPWRGSQLNATAQNPSQGIRIDTAGLTKAVIENTFKLNAGVIDANAHVPTHFRIRGANDSSYVYVNETPLSSIQTGQGIDTMRLPFTIINPSYALSKNQPLIVEFLEAVVNGGTTTYKSTGGTPLYITRVGL